MDVDEAGRDDAARRVELAGASEVRADLADDAIGDRHVGDAARRTAAVQDRAAADHAISRHHDSPLVSFDRASRSFNGRGGAPAVVPPSIGSTMPVICAARSLARYRTALATSGGDPTRWSGCRARTSDA